jgi:UPF0271 protein
MFYLIDSSAILNDFGFSFSEENSYITTPLVIDEFRDVRSRHLMENALQQGLLRIVEPKKESTSYVEEAVEGKGFSRLSKADISLIALALDLKKQGKQFLLLSDDYSIQNFCSLLKIPFEPVIRGKIGKEISFSLVCSGCGKLFPVNSKEKKCSVCGSFLRRKRQENSQKQP